MHSMKKKREKKVTSTEAMAKCQKMRTRARELIPLNSNYLKEVKPL